MSAELAVEHVSKALTYLGYKRIVIRSDGEASLVAFLKAVIKRWGGEVVPEHSPVGDPQSNGAAEMAVGQMKGHIRTLKDALDTRIGAPLPESHPLLTWMARHASHTYRLFHRGPDGRTPSERTAGVRAKRNCAGS